MLSNLKSLCPKRSLIAVALAVGMGSMCVTNYAYSAGNQAKAYAFSHQSVVDVRAILHNSNLYALLLALRAQTPEIETTAYHAMVLSLLHEIASNTHSSVNKLTDIDVPYITEGNGGIQQFSHLKNAGDEPDGKLSSFYEAQMSNDRHRLAARIQSNSDQVSCELNRGK